MPLGLVSVAMVRLCDLRGVTASLGLGAGHRQWDEYALLSRLVGLQPSCPAVTPHRAALADSLTLQCSVTCGAGIRRRSVTCRSDEGSLLHASACSLEDQPPLTEPCVREACPLLNVQAWHVGAWGLVSVCPSPYLPTSLVPRSWGTFPFPSSCGCPSLRVSIFPLPPLAPVLQELQLWDSEATGRLCPRAAQPL